MCSGQSKNTARHSLEAQIFMHSCQKENEEPTGIKFKYNQNLQVLQTHFLLSKPYTSLVLFLYKLNICIVHSAKLKHFSDLALHRLVLCENSASCLVWTQDDFIKSQLILVIHLKRCASHMSSSTMEKLSTIYPRLPQRWLLTGGPGGSLGSNSLSRNLYCHVSYSR